MSSDASILAAATTLVEWAHHRRRAWTDAPLPRVQVREVLEVPEVLEVAAVQEVPEVREVAEAFEIKEGLEALDAEQPATFFDVVDELPAQLPHFGDVPDVDANSEAFVDFEEPTESPAAFEPAALELTAESSNPVPPTEIQTDAPIAAAEEELPVAKARRSWTDATAGIMVFLRVCASGLAKVLMKAGDIAAAVFDGVGPWSDVALWCLTRGAALVSMASVLAFIALHRADLFSRWNRLTETVAAATAPRPVAPPVVALPPGSGRLVIASSDDAPQVLVDGKPQGGAPVSVIVPAGVHRLLLRGPKGSIERNVRVEAGETTDINEDIFPGWVAVASSVDLTISENGRTLKRDERGWVIFPPGPHDVHLDNDSLGIHETRHVVVTPGDATRLSLAPPSSSLSITTSEPAEVWVDGTSLGESPIADTPMKLGMHDVRARSAAHEKWLRVRVTTQPTQVNVDLAGE